MPAPRTSLADVIARIERGETLRTIAPDLGVTRQALTQRLAPAFAADPSLRDRVRQNAAAVAGPKIAGRWAAKRKPPPEKARCAHCGRVLRMRPRPDGRPSFCGTGACQTARELLKLSTPEGRAQRRAYQQSERYRAMQREYARRSRERRVQGDSS